MKLSSNSADQNVNHLPVADWLPNDFLTNSWVDLTPPPGSEKKGSGGIKEKKILNLKDALALLQPSLVKLPIVDSPRYKKVVHDEDSLDMIVMWQPLDLSSPVSPQNNSKEIEIDEIIQEPEPSEEEVVRRSEVLNEIEQKLNQANNALEQAQQQADEVLTQARNQAEKMISETQSQVDLIRQSAFEEGALASKAQNEKQIEQIAVMIKETQIWRNQILEHSEPTIIRMVQTISKKLFGSGFVLDAPGIEQMVGRAINEANRLGNLRIYVNPEDHSLLLSLWQESDLVVSGQKILLIPSQNIIRGGCFVEGEFGSVDSRIDMQIDRLEKELNNTLANHEQEKQKQMEFSPVEKVQTDPTPSSPVNLDALDQIRVNLAPDHPSLETPQENYGFDTVTQPE